MKNIIIKLMLAVAVLFAASGCDKNSFNEGLDGFDPNTGGIEDVQSLVLTLGDAEYKGIAENKTNIEIAKKAGLEAELKALAKQKYFTDEISPKDYLPAYLTATYSTYMTNGSKIKVVYNNYENAPEQLAFIAAASNYKLKSADYTVAWGEDIVANYFTPAKPAASYLPRILKASITAPEANDYVVATYAYSATEPSTGGEEPEETINKISDITAPGDYIIEGTVKATYARGFILEDPTGAILIYLNAVPNYSLGDVLKIKGTASPYNGCMQIGGTPTIELKYRTLKFAFPTPTTIDGAALEAYLTKPSIKYVKYSGLLTISGFNMNIAVDGAATAVGSISYPATGAVDPSLSGKRVAVTGYLFAVSKSGGAPKYPNTMLTSICEEGSTPEFTPIGIVATADGGAYDVKGTICAVYERGFLVNDGTGSILMYTNAAHSYKIGDLVSVSGTTSAYSGLMQYPATATITKLNTEDGTFKYPVALAWTGEDMDEYLTMPTAQYVKYTGTLDISGTAPKLYYNIICDDAVTAQGSLSYPNPSMVPDALNGKKVVVEGYTIGMSMSSGAPKFMNTMVTAIKEATPATTAAFASTRAAVTVDRYALYKFNGTAWESPATATIVSPEDYTQMGITAPNFSTTVNPDIYLPTFLKLKFPYAQKDAIKDVAYHFGNTTTLKADQYKFDGNEWIKNMNIVSLNAPFEMVGGKWNYNPSQTITIYPVKNNPLAKIYYQAGCDYVVAEKAAEYRYNKTGLDGEYYSGCSAFYGNLSWKLDPSSTSSPIYYWALAGEDVSAYDVATQGVQKAKAAYYKELEKRFAEVMTAGLAIVHPTEAPIPGIEILYTLNLGAYTGSNLGETEVTHAFVFRLIDKGTFEYVSMTALAPEYELPK